MIKVEPLRGMRAGVEVDAGIDAILLVDPLTPKGRRIGIADRRPGAPAQLFEPVGESVVEEIREALDARDFDDLPEDKQAMARGRREVAPPPPEIEDEDDEDDEDDEQ